MIDMIILQAISAYSIPLGKKLLLYSPPFFLAGSRLFLAGILLLSYHCGYKKKSITIAKHQWYTYLQIIFFGVYAKYLLRYWSLQYLSVTQMSCFFLCTPFIAAVLCAFLGLEALAVYQLGGMLIGLLGMVPLFLVTSDYAQLTHAFWSFSIPEVVLFLAILAHCYSMILTQKLMREGQQPVILANGVRMLGGGFACLCTAIMIEGFFPITQFVPFISGIIVLIILSNVVCHSWSMHLHTKYSVTFLSFADLLSPLFTGLYGWFLFSEKLTWHYGISMLLSLVGLYLLYIDNMKKSPLHNFS